MKSNNNDYNKISRSWYCTRPGDENHSYTIPGFIFMKPGIYNSLENPQHYVNRRYMKSELFASGRVSKVTKKGMEAIETKVLECLEDAGWIKIKREHFIISKDKEHVFASHVKSLYDYFTIKRPIEPV